MGEKNLGKDKKHGHPEFFKILEEMSDLHERKNADYAGGGAPLGNFYRVGEMAERYNLRFDTGRPALKVAILFMLKQIDAAIWMISEDREGKVEGVVERLRDIAVYAPIAEILYKEGR